MSKKISFLQIILIGLLFAFPVFAQDLNGDLNNFFIKYDLIRLDNQAARQNAENGQMILIRTSERAFQLALVPNDLRSPRYRAEETSANGVSQLQKSAVNTFKGTVSGEGNSMVRLMIGDSALEGYFDSNGTRFFIEPARKYSRFASEDELIIYRETDLRNDYGFFCETSVGQKIERGKEIAAVNSTNRFSPLRVIEIATDADFEYVTALGSSAQANSEILGILNMAEGIYETELGLTFSVVYQHTWSTQDPFGGVDRPGLLASFKDHWNVNFPDSQYRRDVAHLFTGKGFALSAGHAYIGVICANSAFAYGLSGYINWAPGKFLITTHELGHNLGAHHADAAESCSNTLMNPLLSGSTPLTFCAFSQGEMTNFVTANGACLDSLSGAQCDFDGDSKTDFSIFRPAPGEWWYLRSSDGLNRAAQFGNSADRIMPADYTGDGKTDVAIFRPVSGEWFILRSEDSSYYSFPFGTSGDIPAPADFDGDGKADAAVFRPATATWFISRSSGGTTIQQFGANGDFPTAGDYDGDGQADIAIYRPSNGQWWLQRSTSGTVAYQFGNGLDKPVAADYTGDGKTDVAIFRPSNGNWYVLRSEDLSFYSAPFGISTDVPTPGDYDGDGKADFAIFRPTDANWYVNKSSGGNLIRQFGLPGDKPVPSAFVP
jgi:hypothetical protein